MTRREQNLRVRQIVREVTRDSKARVRSGKGTGSNWWTIEAFHTKSDMAEVERRCCQEGLLTHYWPDDGQTHPRACHCVHWRGPLMPEPKEDGVKAVLRDVANLMGPGAKEDKAMELLREVAKILRGDGAYGIRDSEG